VTKKPNRIRCRWLCLRAMRGAAAEDSSRPIVAGTNT
jgi:hypothetical protein